MLCHTFFLNIWPLQVLVLFCFYLMLENLDKKQNVLEQRKVGAHGELTWEN